MSELTQNELSEVSGGGPLFVRCGVVQHGDAIGRPPGALRHELGQGVEAADVVPPHGHGHGGHPPGGGDGLGDGVIDGDRLQARPGGGEHLLALGAVPGAAMASTPAASAGRRAARWSSRTPARATNMPAFQR